MVATHCPSVSAGTLNPGQLPVPNVPGYGTIQVPATVDGVCVAFGSLANTQILFSSVLVDTGGILPQAWGTWVAALLADNWAVVGFPSYPETGFVGDPVAGLIGDVTSATGNNGGQYLATTFELLDHVFIYCHQRWPGKKIIVIGMSEGGYECLNVAQFKLSSIIGGVILNPPTIWENCSPGFTPGYNFSSYNWSNMNAGPTCLNACNKPFLYQYGTTDSAVGWQNPGGSLPTSNTDAIITNAVAAGMPITRQATTNNHDFTVSDVNNTFMPYIEATLDPLR